MLNTTFVPPKPEHRPFNPRPQTPIPEHTQHLPGLGAAPVSYPEPRTRSPKPETRNQVWAQYPYEAANSDELSFLHPLLASGLKLRTRIVLESYIRQMPWVLWPPWGRCVSL